MPSTPTPAPALPHSRTALPALLLVVLFAFQVRFPPLSYPALGQFILVLIAGLILLPAARLFTKDEQASAAPSLFTRHAALLPGFLFVAWGLIRWLYDGMPADGAATVGTFFWAAAFLLATLALTPAQTPNAVLPAKPDPTPDLPRYLLHGLCLIGLACGAYAIAQHGWLYKQSYDALLAAIGPRPPDRSEAALLHHLNLRRVASFWGDPNSYAAFATLAFAACIEIFAGRGHSHPRSNNALRLLWQAIAGISMVACTAGIFYTGSRGGVLDLLIVLALYACLTLLTWRHNRALPSILILAMLPAFIFIPSAPVVAQNTNPKATSALQSANPSAVPPTAEEPGWVWRSDTIRERVYYLEVGVKMIKMAPITGLGPGSINDYFGRLKNPNAREARHLHNWPVNIWAEFGAIGLGLMLWFLGAIVAAIWRARLWRQPVYRCFGVIFIIILFDGLLQTSWSQRELMCLFGAVCGILITATATSPNITRGLKLRRAAAATIITLGLLALEIPYLTAASDKQIASDAMMANQPEAALEYWGKASRWAPHDPAPYQARAQMAIAAGQLSTANLLLNHALSLNPESAALHSESANLALLLNEPDQAEKQIQRAIELYPSHPQYNLQYARFLQSQGQISKAITYAERAREYSYEPEETAEIMAFLSQLYAQQNKPVK